MHPHRSRSTASPSVHLPCREHPCWRAMPRAFMPLAGIHQPNSGGREASSLRRRPVNNTVSVPSTLCSALPLYHWLRPLHAPAAHRGSDTVMKPAGDQSHNMKLKRVNIKKETLFPPPIAACYYYLLHVVQIQGFVHFLNPRDV